MLKRSISLSARAGQRMVWILAMLVCSFSASAADNSAELENLYNALNMLNQEQKAIFQQFQMVQAMLHMAPQEIKLQQQLQQMGDFPNYYDLIEQRKNADRREEKLYQQSEKLIERYNEIEEQKKPLLEQIYSLTLSNK